jgi:hypothetical protein
MAFVFREELKSIFENNADKNLGPGVYFKKENEKFEKKNKIPFLASSPRIKSAKKSLNPGPGHYYEDNQFRHIKEDKAYNKLKRQEDQLQKEKVGINNIFKSLENENILENVDHMEFFVNDQLEKMGFLSKNKRFKEEFKFEVPGPGSYIKLKPKSANVLKIKKTNLKKGSLKKELKIQRETIPAKNHAFGFDFDDNGNLKRNPDPLENKKFRGDRANSVGPGNYEIIKPSDWKKKGTIKYGNGIDEKSKTQNNFFSKKSDVISNLNKISDINSNNNFNNYNNNYNNYNQIINRSFTPEIKKNLLENTALKEKLDLQKDGNLNMNLNNNDKDNNMQKFASNTMMNFYNSKNDFNKTKESKKRCFSSLRSAFQRKRNIGKKDENSSVKTENFPYKIYDKKHFKEFSERLSRSFDLNEYNNVNNIKTETGIVLKFLKDRNKKIKEKQLLNHKNKLFDRSDLLRNKKNDYLPGPGYYLEENNLTSFKSNALPDYQQSFGSYQNRFKICKTEDNNNIGPGAYFKEEIKIEKEKYKINKEKIMIPQMNKIKSYKPVKIEHNINPGPGEYDPQNNNKRRVQTAGANFGSIEPRFKKEDKILKANIPGPGSYDQQNNWNKFENIKSNNNNNKKLKPLSANPNPRLLAQNNEMKINSELKTEPNVQVKHIKKNFETPGVGAYNLDTIFSLEYKVAKNCSKNTIAFAPFNQTKSRPRFDIPKAQMGHPIVGPGIYHKIEQKKLKQIYPPFKSAEKRFRQSKSQYKTNPGQYDPSSYFDWNKKSFNILYL